MTVAGLRFYSYWNHPEDLTGKAVTFEPEPTNPYDPKAIKIMLDGKQLGHVPRTQTGVIHDKLEKGFVVDGVITHHYPRAVVVHAFFITTPTQDLEHFKNNPLPGEQTVLDDLENEGLPGDPSEYGDQ